jgi:FkbM family methyltransferase
MTSTRITQFFTQARKLTLWRIRLRIDRLLPSKLHQFMKQVPGVIHVGANNGGERDEYAKYGLRVVWVEPNPDVFEVLQKNILGYVGQKAFQYLVTDQDDKEYDFHIANNKGLSSSILDLKLHLELCPEIVYERTIKLRSTTLTSLLMKESIRASDYPALVMDTQGSELLVLKGATEILSSFQFVKVEVADFEAYKDCCQLNDIDLFMKQNGFNEISRSKFAEHYAGGSYYDIVYKRDA